MSDNEFDNDDFEESLNEELDRPRNQFILDEAESSGGEEEEYYEDEDDMEVDEEYDTSSRKPVQRRKKEPEMDAEAIAARLEAKYGGQQYDEQQYFAPEGGISNMKYYPRSLLMPERNDPSLFVVKCVPGREAAIILNLSKAPQRILSCFYRDHIKGYIYIEAYQKQHAVQAVEHIPYVFKKCTVVPLQEMPQCLRDNKEENVIQGAWIRCKRGKYKMDIARIVAVSPSRESVRIQLIPRLDLSEVELDENGKKIKSLTRPKARKFEIKDVPSYLKKQITRNNRGYFVLNNDSFKDGYLEKEIKVSNIILDARPTRKEISDFYNKLGQTDFQIDDQTIDQLRAGEQSLVKAGDLVCVFRGELLNLKVQVESVERRLAKTRLLHDIENGPSRNSILHFPVDDLRKTFDKGSHVKLLAGAHVHETGLVIESTVSEVIVLLDGVYEQIKVSPHELAESFDISSKIPNFEQSNVKPTKDVYGIQDLIKYFIGNRILYGCIFQVINDKYVCLNQFNEVDTIRKSQILDHRHRKARTIKTGRDVDGYLTRDVQFRAVTNGDNLQSVLPNDNRDGTCVHIHKNYVWVASRSTKENGGLFVTHGENLKLVGGNVKPYLHNDQIINFKELLAKTTTKAEAANEPVRRNKTRELLNQSTKITKGPYRGYIGTIQDVFTNTCRIILHTNSKCVDVPLDYINPRDPTITSQSRSLQLQPTNGDNFNLGTTPANWQSSNTPSAQGWGQTPNFNNIQTPNFNNIQTPNFNNIQTPDLSKIESPTKKTPVAVTQIDQPSEMGVLVENELKSKGLAFNILLQYEDTYLMAELYTKDHVQGRLVYVSGNAIDVRSDVIKAPIENVKAVSCTEKGQACKIIANDSSFGCVGEVFTKNKDEFVVKTVDFGYKVFSVDCVARLVNDE
eukprot:NODE_799_length_4136_cov_0.244488.p1 type:complete len:907 gc:universal NODE_799_length_4136_cov_0.244488:118-2838(+)